MAVLFYLWYNRASMDKAVLEERRQQSEQRFNELERQKTTISEEMNRLQGEYRVLGELIDNLNKKEEDGSKPRRAKEPVG